ncbi:MAG TPA: hypothetical protein EYP23_06250, partial [Thermoplasmata archaeon]|nr:hypothetical protein [Thermoplasmata archaeon]
MNTKQIIKNIENGVKKVENSKLPFIYFFFTFLSAVTLRSFLETYSDTPVGNLHSYTAANLLHYYLWYTGLALIITIILHLAVRERLEKIAKLVFPAFLVLIVVPIVDILMSGGKGFDMSYMLPGVHEDLLIRWLTFSGSYVGMGATPGMMIEVIFVLIGCFTYVYMKKRSVLRGLFFTFLVYSTVFWWGCIPFAIKYFLELFSVEYAFTSKVALNFILLLLIVIGSITFYLYNKKYFLEIIKDIRPFRALHYELMFVLGVALACNLFNVSIELNRETLFKWFFAPFVILFAGLFSVFVNNLADIEIDKITNKKRPLITRKIRVEDYKKMTTLFFFLATIYSAAINHVTLFLILLFMGNYFLYSTPPLRLKRIPFFSKLLLSLNSLMLVILGYYFVTGFTSLFPVEVTLFFVVGYTAVINFIDLKDYEGDKEAGIKTIPTLLGLRKGKLVIGSFFPILYVVAILYLKNNLLIPVAAGVGILQFLLINRRNYDEKLVFIVY